MSIIWITHDLGIIAGIAERVWSCMVAFSSRKHLVKELYVDPKHPYTQGLLGSLPRLEERTVDRLTNIQGQPPNFLANQRFVHFAPRCPYVFEPCLEENPAILSIGEMSMK